MSFEDWQKENKTMGYWPPTEAVAEKPATGFDAWQQENKKLGFAPPAELSDHALDLAYDSYSKTIPKGIHMWTRNAFKKRGLAKEWIEKGASRVHRSHFEKLAEATRRGSEMFSTDQQYFDAVMLGKGNPDEIYKRSRTLQAQDQIDPITGNMLEQMEYGTARILPGMIQGSKQALPVIAAGGITGLIAGSAGPQALSPFEDIPLVATGMITGLKVGSTYAWYRQGAGEMLMSMRDKGLDDRTSKTIASFAALPYALIEQMQIGQVTPGFRKAAGKVIQKSITGVIGRALKKYGKTITQETLEEVLQEGVMIIADDMAAFFDGQGLPISREELIERANRLMVTGKESAKAMALLPIPGLAVDLKVGDTGLKMVNKFKKVYSDKQAYSIARAVQRGAPIREAHKMALDETIVEAHNKEGGATISPYNLKSEQRGVAVGMYPNRGVVLEGSEITTDQLAEFREKNSEVMAQDRDLIIGTWYDKGDNKTYIDMTKVVETREEAMQIGRQHDQKAVYDITAGETLDVEKAKMPAEVAERVDRRLAERGMEPMGAPDQEAKVSDIDIPTTADEAIGSQYGLTSKDTQDRLVAAEDKYRKLKNKPVKERTGADIKELAFLSRERTNIEALLERDTLPVEKLMSKKRALKLAHTIPNSLGWTDVERREFIFKKTGKRSMKDLKPAQRDQVVRALMALSKREGIDKKELEQSIMIDLLDKLRERKQVPALGRRDRRMLGKMHTILHDVKSGIKAYFLNSSRVKRISRALDNYEDDGPFVTNIYEPVKEADTKANVNFTATMENAVDQYEEVGIDAANMMTEVKEVEGLDDRLATSERIGVYALAQNEKTFNHLLADFSEAQILDIIASVESSAEEMLVAENIKAYFEQGWFEFERAAKQYGITELVKEQDYITAFVSDRDDVMVPDFLGGLMQQFGGKFVPGQQHTIQRQGGKRSLELDIFVIHARAAKSLERFKAMAPVAKNVGDLLKNNIFKQELNDATYGHGSKIYNKWLEDSVRGSGAYDSTDLGKAMRWLRRSGMNFVIGYKILVAGKQGISLGQAMAVHPGMVPLVFNNLKNAAIPDRYNAMQKFAFSKSKLMETRSWDRDLRAVWSKKAVKRKYAGKNLSPASMRMASWVDRHTTVVAWTSAFELSMKQGMNEADSVRFADGVIEDTQPMGHAVDLPAFFRGSELAKALTVFQNQVNQNGQYLWYNILGEAKSKKINYAEAGYRLLMSQILPALLLGLISRGRPPETPGEIAKDLFFFMATPFTFVGRWLYNILTGDYGATKLIAEEPFVETGRMVSAIKQGDLRKSLRYGARAAGAWSGGRVPLQAITTAEGMWDLSTGETEDFRELVWSKYALRERSSGSKSTDYRKGFKP